MKKYTRRDFVQTTTTAGLGFGLTKKIAPEYSSGTAEGKRIGIIGLDGSHAVAFTQSINDPSLVSEYNGYKVVAAYPKGSNDIQSSVSRVAGYTEDMKKLGIEIVGSVEELCSKVDALFMVTNDGRRHLEQALIVFKAGKRMFIDKPFAASLKDGMDIFAASKFYKVPVYSCSNARFTPVHQEVANGKIGKVIGADVYGPSPIEKTHPTLFWYGIHSVEALCTMMGTGCKSVVRVFNDDTDISVGIWPDNRLGVNRAMRVGQRGQGGTAYGDKGIASLTRVSGGEAKGQANPAYKKMIEFFATGIVPVTEEQTLEILAFMEAADESKLNGGKPIDLAMVMERARNAKDRLKLR
jgi:predicted dehydrogenase